VSNRGDNVIARLETTIKSFAFLVGYDLPADQSQMESNREDASSDQNNSGLMEFSTIFNEKLKKR
jgi:hypothetical protein